MGTLITIWFAVTGIYYLCAATLRLAVRLPAIIVFIVALPAMPFIVAYRNRTEHPKQAKAIYWMGGVLYVLITIILLIDGHL